jgi:hypothetical protein
MIRVHQVPFGLFVLFLVVFARGSIAAVGDIDRAGWQFFHTGSEIVRAPPGFWTPARGDCRFCLFAAPG